MQLWRTEERAGKRTAHQPVEKLATHLVMLGGYRCCHSLAGAQLNWGARVAFEKALEAWHGWKAMS